MRYSRKINKTRKHRRTRLRHRKIRFSNRISEKLIPTIRSMVNFRIYTLLKLLKLYPITKVIVEDVRFNHYRSNQGSSFSQVEVGKTALYNFIKSQNLELELYNGYNTSKLRINSFGTDIKSRDKASKTFTAHCIDSFVLGCEKICVIDYTTGEIFTDQPRIIFNGVLNKITKFITKIHPVRRHLHKEKNNIGERKYYFRYGKGGIKELYIKEGKTNICRVKPSGEQSNHPKMWVYINNEVKQCWKKFRTNYGGSIAVGKSGYDVPRGKSKNSVYSNGRNGGILYGYKNRDYVFN